MRSMILPVVALLTVLGTATSPASAQARRPAPVPALVVKVADRFEPLTVKALAVEARIVGHLAETAMTMTFYNPHRRALSGELVFPLPEGATVSGYGLDVEGVLVDGVVVDKDEARRAFEIEVRKGVDPGLVEWSGGNNFKTRVFPIPAGGTRTVMVRYIAELADGRRGPVYDLPLKFKKKVESFSLRVEVVQSESAPPTIKGGPRGLRFKAWRSSFVAETSKKNIRLTRDLRITLPAMDREPVRVEKAADGGVYFSVVAQPPIPSSEAMSAPKRVRLAWDASASRANADLDRELGVLSRYLKSLGRARVSVDLAIVRHAAEPVRAFEMPAQRGALLEVLRGIRYDGGTQLAALKPAAGSRPVDLVLVFTDGISNFGLEDPGALGAAAWIFNSASTANHAFLQYLALQSGGAYLNLGRVSDAEALAGVGKPVFSFQGATVREGEEVVTWPRISRPVSGPFALAGKLSGDQAVVTLSFGIGGRVLHQKTVTVRAADAAEGELLKYHWAQKQLEDLLVFPKRNAEEIATLGKAFSIVTPTTSLIVLERLDQYLEHGIRPPASLASMRAQWDFEFARRDVLEKADAQSKLEHVLALWQGRITWYDKTFTYPKNFRFGASKAKSARSGRGSGVGAQGLGAGGGGVGAGRVHQSGRRALSEVFEDAEELEEESGAMSGSAPSSKKVKESGPGKVDAAIVLAPWDPQTPYLKALKKAAEGARFDVYVAQRVRHGSAPAFFLDCADFFRTSGDEALALQVLSNIAEMELEDPALLRILAHRLVQLEELDLGILLFERVRILRPEEPQSFRDLALALERRGDARGGKDRRGAAADYARAMTLLARVVMDRWDRFDQIELIALVELNHILPKARKLGVNELPVDPRLVRPLQLDVRIAMSWDADMTDMDVHIVEPSGEEAYYSHNRTTIGGLVSRDFTQGYGPEVYLLRRAMHGVYKVKTKYFGSSAAQLAGAVTLQLDIFTNYGRPNESRRSVTFRLTENKEMFTVGEIEL